MKRMLMIFAINMLIYINNVYAQEIAVKTNLLYWATTTPNISMEFKTSLKYTLNMAIGYNAWAFRNDMTLRHYLFQPELRYWPCKAFERHFFGIHALYGRYNVGRISFIDDLETRTYKGYMAGAGVSVGYHWAVGKRWGIEATLGLGYVHFRYNKYICQECAELEGRYKRNYYGPTKLGVSIIYLFN